MLSLLLGAIGGGLILYGLWDYTAAIGSVLWASIGGAVLLLASIGAILLLYNLWGHMGAIRTMLLGSIGGGLLLYTLWDYTAAIGSVLWASIGGAVLLLASIGLSLSLCTLWIHMGAIRTVLLAAIGGGLLLYTLWDYTAAIGSVLWASIWGAVLLLASIGAALSLCTLWIPYLYADLKAFLTLLSSSLRSRWRLSRRPPLTLLRRFLYHAGRRPQHPMLLYRDQLFTYRDMDLWSNRAARSFALQLGCNGGGCVAVFLPNVPVYVCTWLALAKLGCAMACINCNLKGRALLHAIRAAGPAAVLSCNELHVAIEEVLPALQQDGVRVFYLDPTSPTPGVPALQPHIESCSDDPVPDRYRTGTTGSSKAVYIYTSGTTGLPKAAVITEMKVLLVASLAQMCGLRGDDVVLTTLPLYHSAGLLIGVGGCIEVGATCVLRSKFSASQFWADCRKYNVTVIQYVGELLRYLCNTPKSPSDRDHNVRLAIGNGLRGNVWTEFLQRFGPIEISEFYGATEGNAGFINYTGKVGAVGRANVFLKVFSSFELIQYDVEQDEPVRNQDGFCIRVRPGETGLLVIRITRNTPFHGYAGDKSRTEKKILRDVFDKGDSYFNSGDLLMMDRERFLYFQDRVGDTFRWKGENVATTEVEAALSMVDFIQEVNVYGVAVPGEQQRGAENPPKWLNLELLTQNRSPLGFITTKTGLRRHQDG
ncbi:very long-chain acyl-CoA synthetase-like isoform X2 [Coturnix japonica]|uniref:very long-chain acyl-CoA synthetase-like isoform X2 n=1 Tax=Coturnix japonica TaxID=93934 RepID=UPI0013A5C7FD|nr:very long-chain acyl-CoA synthetase-like isoform X2 [Coturnix japonica]